MAKRGRPAMGHKKILLSVPPDVAAALASRAKGDGVTKSDVATLALRRYLRLPAPKPARRPR